MDRTLNIRAERKVVHDTTQNMVHSVERSFGRVQRQLLLPLNADLDNSQSDFHNGVLTITLPKKDTTGGPFTRKLAINM
jgi:HSP20 family protein